MYEKMRLAELNLQMENCKQIAIQSERSTKQQCVSMAQPYTPENFEQTMKNAQIMWDFIK
jgi:hypothetical protein